MEVRKEQLETIERWAGYRARKLRRDCPGQESQLGDDYYSWIFGAGCAAVLRSGLKLADFPDPDSFSRWAGQVATNAAKDASKTSWFRFHRALEYAECCSIAASPEEAFQIYYRQLEARSDIARLRKVLSAEALEALSLFLEYGEVRRAARELQARRSSAGKSRRKIYHYQGEIRRALMWAWKILAE